MLHKTILGILTIIFLSGSFFLLRPLYAAEEKSSDIFHLDLIKNQTQQLRFFYIPAGYIKSPIQNVFTILIYFALVGSGIVFIGFMVYAGYLWLIAAGSDTLIKKARETLLYSFLGLIIVLAGYSITYYILKNLNQIINSDLDSNEMRGSVEQ